ncbi:PP2C family protein-serine/threonine phosphatase [Micromonospora endophytica]|uniref:Serine/threonine-protein phosphatase n=1 Tax=Micromonospora endophytica TaxID=515350 RepID=A0A2W2DEZ6_9ACTN|nr:PP2C family protein-serine/threonine phosphatase [Micromonospora endophytica]PZF98427.1 serine/threonine-protein phosphatase [Micromonospora endophytica]RIW50894.1 serine/threonine-protein phosphatase [Micromonospora endophytica]BCJ60590.1 phosphatase [Micromonospora endophytica]
MSEPVHRARAAITDAPVDLLVQRVATLLKQEHAITETELLQVDYRLAALIPLSAGEEVREAGHPAWRCFDHQVPLYADGTGYLPVSMRGERRGVLRLAPVTDAEQLTGLWEIATALAHEIAAVDAGTDVYRVARRTQRLTLAAEVQWELLPGRSRNRPSFSLAGQLEPAYAVRGDSFDWSDDGESVWTATINGMGEGVAASMLTTLATCALRNARRAGVSLADQAALADQAIYSMYRGEQHVSTLLLQIDLRSGLLSIVDAGSPRLILLRNGEVSVQALEAQFPLGMFEGTHYQEQQIQLQPADRLFMISDGVIEAAGQNMRYGATALDRMLRRTKPMRPLDAVRSILGDLRAFVAGDLTDDAVVVCLDWFGPQP